MLQYILAQAPPLPQLRAPLAGVKRCRAAAQYSMSAATTSSKHLHMQLSLWRLLGRTPRSPLAAA
jgi:hypothetical protein